MISKGGKVKTNWSIFYVFRLPYIIWYIFTPFADQKHSGTSNNSI